MSEINNYDPNPYDNVTIDEALTQIYDRVNDRTIRQIVTLLKKAIDSGGTGDISRYTVEKTTAESGEVTYKLMQQINNGTPTPVGDTVGLRGSQILANYDEELQILDNIINVIKVALDGKADTTDIPTVPIIAIQKNGTGITPVDGTVNITVPIVAADVAALPDTTRYAAALSLTIDSATFVVTGQLKDQNGDNLGTAQTIDLPLESVVVGGSYNSQTQKVVLTLQNGNTIEFSVADLVYGLQTELSESNKLNPAYINYDNTHRAVSDDEKSAWNSKQTALSQTQLNAVNSGIDSTKVDQIETNKNNILSKADKISFGFSGNPNPAVYVKDWDFVPDGTYLLTYICSQDASNRSGVSVYMFTKYTTNHIVLFTPIVEVSGATITSCVASGSAGAETITFTMAQRGYHTGVAIQIQAF